MLEARLQSDAGHSGTTKQNKTKNTWKKKQKKTQKKTQPWGTCLSQSFPRIFCFCFFSYIFLIAFCFFWLLFVFFAFLRLLSRHGSCHFGFYGFWKVEVFAIFFWFLGSRWYQMGLSMHDPNHRAYYVVLYSNILETSIVFGEIWNILQWQHPNGKKTR